jgi:hypothetical protein
MWSSPVLRISLICCVVLACGREPLDLSPSAAPGGSGSAGASAAGATAGPAGMTGAAGSMGVAGLTGAAGMTGAAGTMGVAGGAERIPTMHRPTAMACPTMTLPASAPTTCPFAGEGKGVGVPGWCNSVSDCTEGKDPRCVGAIPSGKCSCTYDACFSDRDCPANHVCACSGVYSGNACVAGNCRIDADCGTGGYCSPIIDRCTSGVTGYFCRSSKDACANDGDCGAATPNCDRDPVTGVWGCQSIHGCVL